VKREERIEMIIKFSYDINRSVPEVTGRSEYPAAIFRQKKDLRMHVSCVSGPGGML
jgi:hypothetical protein